MQTVVCAPRQNPPIIPDFDEEISVTTLELAAADHVLEKCKPFPACHVFWSRWRWFPKPIDRDRASNDLLFLRIWVEKEPHVAHEVTGELHTGIVVGPQ